MPGEDEKEWMDYGEDGYDPSEYADGYGDDYTEDQEMDYDEEDEVDDMEDYDGLDE